MLSTLNLKKICCSKTRRDLRNIAEGPEANLLQQNQIRAETIYQKHCRGTWEILLQRDLKQTSCSRLNHSKHIAKGPERKNIIQRNLKKTTAKEYSKQEAEIKGYFSFVQTYFGSNIPPVQTTSRSTCTYHLYKQKQGSIFYAILYLNFKFCRNF